MGNKRRARADTCGGGGGLRPGMTATDHNYIERLMFHVKHLFTDTEFAEDQI